MNATTLTCIQYDSNKIPISSLATYDSVQQDIVLSHELLRSHFQSVSLEQARISEPPSPPALDLYTVMSATQKKNVGRIVLTVNEFRMSLETLIRICS